MESIREEAGPAGLCAPRARTIGMCSLDARRVTKKIDAQQGIL